MENLTRVLDTPFWTCCRNDWTYELDACDGTLVSQERPTAHEGSVPANLPIQFRLSVLNPTEEDMSSFAQRSRDIQQPLYLGLHLNDCRREFRYVGEPVIHVRDLETLSTPVAFHVATDEECALNGVDEPCCGGSKIALRAERIIKGPQPPPPAWFLRDNSEIYERDIRQHVEGRIVNWRRLDSYLQDNWRSWKVSNDNADLPGSLRRLVSWGAADYRKYFADGARAASVGAA